MSTTSKESRYLEEKRKLPDGWRWVRLGDVAKVVNGFGFTESLQGRVDLPYPFIKVSDMNSPGAEIIINKAANTVDDKILKHLGARCYPKGTVVFPKVGGALLTNKKRVLGRESSFDNNIMGVVPKSIDSEFLFFWFCTIDLASFANTQALPSIRQSLVASFKMPLPPLPEQRRIAGILREQMGVVEKARTAAQTRLMVVKDLPAAFLRQVFPKPGQPLPNGWRWVKLGKVCQIIAGQSPPGSTYRTSPDGLPFFQGKADFGKSNPVARVWCVDPVKIAQTGDILISVRAPVGPTNVADVECCIGRGLSAIRCGVDVNRDFILNAIRNFESSLVKKGSGSTFEAINRDDLESFNIPLPPLPEQRWIAAVFLEQMAAVEKAYAAAEEELNSLNALPAALLRQAFNGKI